MHGAGDKSQSHKIIIRTVFVNSYECVEKFITTSVAFKSTVIQLSLSGKSQVSSNNSHQTLLILGPRDYD